jgi:hypothetical protein
MCATGVNLAHVSRAKFAYVRHVARVYHANVARNKGCYFWTTSSEEILSPVFWGFYYFFGDFIISLVGAGGGGVGEFLPVFFL